MKDTNLEGKYISDNWQLVDYCIAAGEFTSPTPTNRIETRRSGKTTRVIDNTIQLLFSGEIGLINKSGFDFVDKNEAYDLLNRIIKRLESEHKIVAYDYRFNKKLADDSLRDSIQSDIFFYEAYGNPQVPSFGYTIWLDRFIHCVDGVFYRKPTV